MDSQKEFNNNRKRRKLVKAPKVVNDPRVESRCFTLTSENSPHCSSSSPRRDISAARVNSYTIDLKIQPNVIVHNRERILLLVSKLNLSNQIESSYHRKNKFHIEDSEMFIKKTSEILDFNNHMKNSISHESINKNLHQNTAVRKSLNDILHLSIQRMINKHAMSYCQPITQTTPIQYSVNSISPTSHRRVHGITQENISKKMLNKPKIKVMEVSIINTDLNETKNNIQTISRENKTIIKQIDKVQLKNLLRTSSPRSGRPILDESFGFDNSNHKVKQFIGKTQHKPENNAIETFGLNYHGNSSKQNKHDAPCENRIHLKNNQVQPTIISLNTSCPRSSRRIIGRPSKINYNKIRKRQNIPKIEAKRASYANMSQNNTKHDIQIPRKNRMILYEFKTQMDITDNQNFRLSQNDFAVASHSNINRTFPVQDLLQSTNNNFIKLQITACEGNNKQIITLALDLTQFFKGFTENASDENLLPTQRFQVMQENKETPYIETGEVTSEQVPKNRIIIERSSYREFFKLFTNFLRISRNIQYSRLSLRSNLRNWYFMDFYQGHMLDVILRKIHIITLHILQQVYFVIIPNNNPNTKVQLNFNLSEGQFIEPNDILPEILDEEHLNWTQKHSDILQLYKCVSHESVSSGSDNYMQMSYSPSNSYSSQNKRYFSYETLQNDMCSFNCTLVSDSTNQIQPTSLSSRRSTATSYVCSDDVKSASVDSQSCLNQCENYKLSSTDFWFCRTVTSFIEKSKYHIEQNYINESMFEHFSLRNCIKPLMGVCSKVTRQCLWKGVIECMGTSIVNSIICNSVAIAQNTNI